MKTPISYYGGTCLNACLFVNYSMKTASIYRLIDPFTGQVRYIGKANIPTERLAAHVAPSNLDGRTMCKRWIKSLSIKGAKPIMEVIETVSEVDWQAREVYWIAFYRAAGACLCNHTDGGEGLVNPSEATKEKQRANNRKNAATYKTPEFRAKISTISKALVRTPEHCARIAASKLGKPRSEAAKAKMSATRKGKVFMSPERYKEVTKAAAPLLQLANEARKRQVGQFDKHGKLLASYESAAACIAATGLPKGTVHTSISRGNITRTGFIFKYI